MRIFIITTFPIRLPYDDAAKNLAIELVKNLRNHKFTLIGSGKNFLKKFNVKWISFPFPRKKQNMPFSQRALVFFNIGMLHMPKTDIFHFIVTPERYSSLLFRILFRLFGKKSVQTITSIHTLEAKRKYKDLETLFFADKVVCLSDYSKDKLKRAGVKNVKRIYPGISLIRFNPEKIKQAKKLGKGKEHIIVYPGNYKLLDSCYSLDKFCKIIKRTISELHDVRFIMVCRIRSNKDKQLERKFKSLATSYNISDNITYLNLVEDMPSLFKACDLGIYPAEKAMADVFEMPLVLLELMAMKKPIIFGNTPPLNEIMKSKIGVMLSSNSPESYAKEIVRLIKNTKLRKEMGNNGRKTVMKHFNLDDSIKNYETVYKEINKK